MKTMQELVLEMQAETRRQMEDQTRRLLHMALEMFISALGGGKAITNRKAAKKAQRAFAMFVLQELDVTPDELGGDSSEAT
jgi:hypothetical protein